MRHTPDGHHVIINGKRWRATDPELPDDIAGVLRRELMSARRAVGAALRALDREAELVARERVQRAKTALGERGVPWWQQTLEERQARWEQGLASARAQAERSERVVDLKACEEAAYVPALGEG